MFTKWRNHDFGIIYLNSTKLVNKYIIYAFELQQMI